MLNGLLTRGGGSTADLPASSRSGPRVFGADLIRATAISLVFIVHVAGYGFMMLGWTPATPYYDYFQVICGTTGVELFFVLSGYLIGGLLLDIISKSPDLRQWTIFMIRRWMRTIPAYAVWVTVLLVAIPPAAGRLSAGIQYLSFTQNLTWPMPPENWFSVSWSLSVEEWFYLLFSGALFCLARFVRNRSVAIALGVFMLIPLLLRLLFASHVVDWDVGLRKIAVYRLDAIAYGVLLAWILRSWPSLGKRTEAVLFLLGAAVAVGAECLLLHGRPPVFPWIFSFVPAALALVLPFVLHLPTPPLMLASLVKWISTRSYAIYLVHSSIMEFMMRHPFGGIRTVLLIYILGTAVLAELLHRAVELPLIKIRPRQFDTKLVHDAGLAGAAASSRIP